MPPQRVYRALEGGGVRGIAHVGAAAVFDAIPDQYQTVANVGTSGGADAAALLSTGLDPAVAKAATLDFPFGRVVGGVDSIPLVGKFIEGSDLVSHGGMHDGARLEKAIDGSLRKYAGITTYPELDQMIAAGKPGAAKLYITAHDVSHGLVIFPPAYSTLYGITDPSRQSIAFSARASSAIPGFFTPAPITDAHGQTFYLADGGIDAGLPYDVALQLANENDPGARVINFALGENPVDPVRLHQDDNPVFGVEYMFQLVRSISSGRREELMRDPAIRKNTVMINTSGVSTTEFNLTKNQQLYLYNSGVVSALEFVIADLGPKLTTENMTKLSAMAQATRRELMQLTPDAVKGKGGVTPTMLSPLQHRLDAVNTQLEGRATPALA